MTESSFYRNIQHAITDVVARAMDSLLRNKEIVAKLSSNAYEQALLDVATSRHLRIGQWNCLASCLQLLSHLRSHHEHYYNIILSNDTEFNIMDCAVDFFEYNKDNFK